MQSQRGPGSTPMMPPRQAHPNGAQGGGAMPARGNPQQMMMMGQGRQTFPQQQQQGMAQQFPVPQQQPQPQQHLPPGQVQPMFSQGGGGGGGGGGPSPSPYQQQMGPPQSQPQPQPMHRGGSHGGPQGMPMSQTQLPQRGPTQQRGPSPQQQQQWKQQQRGPPQMSMQMPMQQMKMQTPMQMQMSQQMQHQQQPGGQKENYLPTGLNGEWQSDRDMPRRREMIQHIVRLLKQKDKSASTEWLNKLPQMVKQLEVSLYRSALSFEAYSDTSTLKQRLKLLAIEIARKTQSAAGEQGGRGKPDQQQPMQQTPRLQSAGGPPPSQPLGNTMGGQPTGKHFLMQQRRQMAQQQGQQSEEGRNPAMANGPPADLMASTISPSPQLTEQLGPGPGAPGFQSPTGANQGGGGMGLPPNGGLGPPPNGGNGSMDAEWQLRIRHKQQRLLLLHHSSKCPHPPGQCPVTAHCAAMKRLWKHMARCTDNNCRISHCFSSRSILSHYRKCKDPTCPACGPVRETVKKSQAKAARAEAARAGAAGRQRPDQQPFGLSGMDGNAMMDGNTMMGHGGLGGLSNQQNPQNPQHQVPPLNGVQQQQRRDVTPPLPGGMPPPNGALSNSSGPLQQQQHPMQMGDNMPLSVSPNLQPGNRDGTIPPPESQGPPVPAQSDTIPSQAGPKQNHPLQPEAIRSERDGINSTSPTPPQSHTQRGTGEAASAGQDRLVEKKNDPDWQEKIRHKQERLLLLRHASKCKYENGQCKITPYCARMKLLWKHISGCKDPHCKVQHCMSSRYVLSHYRRCKDLRCPACGPVREAIRRSAEKEKLQQLQHEGDSPFRSNLDLMDASTKDDKTSSTPAPQKPQQPSSTSSESADDPKPTDQTPTQPEPKRAKLDVDPTQRTRVVTESSDEVPSAGVSDVASGAADKPSSPPPRAQKPSPPEPKPQPQLSAAPPPPRPVITKKPQMAAAKSYGDHGYSLINCFTVEQIRTHIASLRRSTQLPPTKLKAKCLEVLKGLMSHKHGWVFNCPVDPVELGIPDYFEVIKRPMDLGTIQKRLESGLYHALEDFEADVRRTFDNAMTYNEVGSVVHDMANELTSKFSADHKKLIDKLKQEEEELRKNERACSLCGCEKLLFEPPVYFCNGINCASKRIRRNNNFFVAGNNQYFWCSQCFNELDESLPIELGDMSIKKSELKKKKNDEVHEESWVQCDCCERWVHQICGLFNSRQNKERKSEYKCPHCLLKIREKDGSENEPKTMPSAEDLPRTKLSEWLEDHVRNKVDSKILKLAKEKEGTEDISIDDAREATGCGGPIVIRQVTSTNCSLEVRELMKKRYAHKNYPDEFPFRCKCLVVFQNLDGVDCVLFALYVYEHGENNPAPNKRAVYVSYLDSVHFMRPRKLRTFVYHEILISYLDYVRQKGFATAHIWACPPLRGDDYIFYAKPEDQKIPKDARLRQWYIDMLVECQKREIVGKVTNMYDLYFSNEKLDAADVPYFDGDYFPGEAENIIKDLLEGRGGKNGSGGKKSKKKKNSSNGNTSNGSKSKGQLGSASGRGGTRSSGTDGNGLDDGSDLKQVPRDPVMVKMGDIIKPMKDSFIVAYLNWEEAREEDMVVPKEIMKHRKVAKERQSGDEEEGKLSSKKRDADGNLRPVVSRSLTGKDSSGKVIDDDLEELDCEFFNNRQAFLNLCRGNHYQYDEVRRTKHTSMMVLWHLHNRDAPKFVQQCVSCNREILSGNRHHCPTCEYNLCEECFKNPSTNRGCPHTLQAIPVEGEGGQGHKGESAMTEAQRKERKRNIRLHIQLLEHAASCTSSTCSSSNCKKMKAYLNHGSTCTVKASGGCKICKRIWTLLRIHAQHCRAPQCSIPNCMAIRERIRQLKKQQQAMDDRRRMEMNRHYRHVGS